MEEFSKAIIKRRANNLMEVRHQDLKRADSDSPYVSKCISCNDGVLLMRRNQESGILEILDFCCLCGQAVKYTDVVPGLVYLKYEGE